MVETDWAVMSKLTFIILSIAITGGCYHHLVTRAYDSEQGRRFPYLAYYHGQVLVIENGSPLRFSSKEQAWKYEREYGSEEASIELAGDKPRRNKN